jgi:uncharacterized protein YdaU (DUF1376 family)
MARTNVKKKGKDPAFLFYPNDWIGGTMGMTFEEKGAYMEVLMLQFNRGHMTTHMVGQLVGQLWLNVEAKFRQDDEGLWYNERLEEEQEKRQTFTKSRNNNLSGKNQHSLKPVFDGGHTTSHMEDEDEDVNKEMISNNILYKDTLLKNKEWIKSISNQFKKTETEVLLKMETFFDHLTTEFKVHPSMNEYSKHFKNWLPKNTTENGNTNSKSKQNTNQGYKPASVDREKLIRELAEDAANGNIPGDYSQSRTSSQTQPS